jgi:hypothetical protein
LLVRFVDFCAEVVKLAKQRKAGHLVPGVNDLYRHWERNRTPIAVVSKLRARELARVGQ